MSSRQDTTKPAATEANPIGKPVDRYDGRLKVTGGARYAAEYPLDNLAHAVVLQSTIARGRIADMDTRAAEQAPGVLAVLTHKNAPRLAGTASADGGQSADPFAKPILVLQDPNVTFYGQHIGVVVAETIEQARYAAMLVRVTYQEERPAVVFEENRGRAYKPDKLLIPLEPDTGRGDLRRGLREADVKVDVTYATPVEHHNPLELAATTAHWTAPDRLTLYDATQSVNGVQRALGITLGLKPPNIDVVAAFVGGGFGCKFPTRGHVVLAALAAQRVQRPVKLVLTRPQMFTSVGCRAHSEMRMRLGAKRDGTLTAVGHEITTQTSVTGEFVEHSGAATGHMYNAPHTLVTHRAVPLNLVTPTIMRAPGEAPGMFALESALDELAYALKMDPVALRIKNDPPRDLEKNLPWSSRSLVACLQQGARRFGWNRRNPVPGSMRDRDGLLVGYGVASATYPTNRLPASARVRIEPDGRALVQIAATDIGTGTYTILAQVAGDALGLPADRIRVEIGDSKLPQSPGSGGSWGAASYGSAVHDACVALRARLSALVREDKNSPLQGLADDQIAARDGGLFAKNAPARGETYQAILTRHNLQGMDMQADSKPGEEAQQYSMHAFGAQFCEVRVNPESGEVRVPRFLGVFGTGRILNPKTARSQMLGGIVWGIGMATHEETHVDGRYGHFVNADLAEYHVPVCADIQNIEAVFVEENDPHVNPLGVKGVGEIGIVGVAAAIGNAVFHATGKRIRELPITPDKLL